MSDPFSNQIRLMPETPVDLHELQVKLARMSDAELTAHGKQLRRLLFPKMVSGTGYAHRKAWEIEYEEARAEWRRRHPKK
jgi:hypothetical protein